ncbi:MAG: class I SAM-dependent methyltransferase [Acidimicrobiia bacterium]|nr:class I SAM-dependent methyltransferase [Acidimicrobiia bacterium]
MPTDEPAPELAPSIEIAADIPDVAALARRFRAFDALHHGLEACVPMSGTDLDRVAHFLAVEPHDTVLDIACGHGAMLKRLIGRTSNLTGIDLSPWAIARADRLLASADPRVRLILGDAARLPADRDWTHIICLGASWIFHGFEGTVRALTRRLRPGGTIAIGDLRHRSGSGPAPGAVATATDHRQAVEAAGGSVVDVVVADDEAWDQYSEGVVAAADRYRVQHPGDPSADHRAVAAQYVTDVARDRLTLEFAVVVAIMPGESTDA